ncbi:unnamed protein product [Symbiodinium natans]|uniref:protein-histidine N-methyltransferase n=1 Tax=Symbiodinium natans TaxID=878477 RepID=A0A812S4D4_9DINO|nr:unnamed protein product [Symbiodinium natans]
MESTFLRIEDPGVKAPDCRELRLEGTQPILVVQETQELQPDSVDQASGGLLWEGALDLAQHLQLCLRMDPSDLASESPGGRRVLELGAGHGLPGLMALRMGCRVDFHDFSEQTLRHITAANCVANGIHVNRADIAGQQHNPDPLVRFVAGDWTLLKDKMEAAGLLYDVIIASEAVYKVDFYPDLLALLERLEPGGRAWFAGKRFYFGCGGGTASFAAAAREAGFSVMVDKVLEDGRSNIREILLISKTDATHPGKRQKIQKDEVAEGLQSTQLPTRSCDHPA